MTEAEKLEIKLQATTNVLGKATSILAEFLDLWDLYRSEPDEGRKAELRGRIDNLVDGARMGRPS